MHKENIRTYCYYSVVVALSIGAYYWFNNLGDGIVKALLDFYITVVEVFFNNSHYYNEVLGYYAGNAYNIGKECLGLGIVALVFGCCGILSVKMLQGYKRALGIIISAPAAIIAGIFANILRLISSIYFITFARFELIHALLGIVIYLCVLFFYYRLFVWLNSRAPAIAGTAIKRLEDESLEGESLEGENSKDENSDDENMSDENTDGENSEDERLGDESLEDINLE